MSRIEGLQIQLPANWDSATPGQATIAARTSENPRVQGALGAGDKAVRNFPKGPLLPQGFDGGSSPYFLSRLFSTIDNRPVGQKIREDVSYAVERPGVQDDLNTFIPYFDSHWASEGLPSEWYKLRGEKSEVGFSMNGQMNLLRNLNDPAQVKRWVDQTRMDIAGFKLEYLSDHNIFPCVYMRDPSGAPRLVSTLYGNRGMSEIVSNKEQGGSVKRVMGKLEKFFTADTTPDGALAIVPSLKGDSGLKTDEGKAIIYPDTYFFMMKKVGDKVINYTLKTDFNEQETREAVYRITGKMPAPDASARDLIESYTTINPGERGDIWDVGDFIHILEEVKSTPLKDKPWKDVYQDIKDADTLYNFNVITQKMLNDFVSYASLPGRTRLDYQKAIAATILRISRQYYEDIQTEGYMKPGMWVKPEKIRALTFGKVLKDVSERPGCAGGGNSLTSILSVGGERGAKDIEPYECPKCHYKTNEAVRGENCPNPACSYTKQKAMEEGLATC